MGSREEVERGRGTARGLAATAQRPKSPASPKVPFPAKSPVLKDFRSSGQSSQRHPGNCSCHSWHFSVQYSSTHMVHMCDPHMILSNRACPLHGLNSAAAGASRSATAVKMTTARIVRWICPELGTWAVGFGESRSVH